MATLGIDYGTTNTVVVCSDRGRYPVVPHLAETSVGTVARETMPSLVAYDRRKQKFLYGSDAERCLFAPQAEERFGIIPSLKRLLRDYSENARVGLDIVPGGFSMEEVLRGFADAVMTSVRKSGLYPADEEWRAVLTWPANANGAQRYVTRQAFKDAGFQVVAGLNEPSAAAIEFADRLARGNRAKARQLSASVAIFDLGGGTFDVSLVNVKGLDFNVIDSAGIERLGGDDFDEVLAQLFACKMKVNLESLRPFQQVLMRTHARQQKESISHGAPRSLTLSPGDLGLKGRVVAVSVTDYYKALTPLLAPAVEKLGSLLDGIAAQDAAMDADRLDAVYLVGGSAKLPLIHKLLKKRFPKARLVVSDKPFSSTAMGAAIHKVEEVRLHDILGRTFGVMRLADFGRKEFFAPIFQAGMKLPEDSAAPRTHRVQYHPQHNLGHLRYLECSRVDEEGLPAEGVRHWSETVFPYDPAIPVGGDLTADTITNRPDLEQTPVCETYTCDKDGVITVNIQRFCDGQGLSCEIFRA